MCRRHSLPLHANKREGWSQIRNQQKGWTRTSANIIPVHLQCTVCKKVLQIRQNLLTKNAQHPEQCTYNRAIYSLFRCLGGQLRAPDIYFFFLYIFYSTLFPLPPLRFNCVRGCCDRTQDCCDFGIDSQTL